MNKFIQCDEIAVVQDNNVTVILVPSTGKIHELDEIGSLIWTHIPKSGPGISVDELTRIIIEEYDVQYCTAYKDIHSLVSDLLYEKIIDKAHQT